MDWREAEHLKRVIEDDAPALKPRKHQIDNGEHVVKIASGAIWIWSEEDWEAHKNDKDIMAKRLVA